VGVAQQISAQVSTNGKIEERSHEGSGLSEDQWEGALKGVANERGKGRSLGRSGLANQCLCKNQWVSGGEEPWWVWPKK
jgi:hypothetical protein